MMKKYTKIKTEQVIDSETAEVVSAKETATVIGIDREPKHITLYLKDIAALYAIPVSLQKILFELLQFATKDNMIYTSGSVREKICRMFGIKLETLQNRLCMLSKAGLLLKNSKFNNEYRLNAKVFGKGNWSAIAKLRNEFKTTILYKKGKRKITHEFKD